MRNQKKAPGLVRTLLTVPCPLLASGITLATAFPAAAEIERDLDDKGGRLGYFEIACKRIAEAHAKIVSKIIEISVDTASG